MHYKQNELIKALYVIDEVINVEKNRLKSGGKVGSLTHAHIFRHTVFKRLKEDELACNELKEIYKLYTTMRLEFEYIQIEKFFKDDKYKDFKFLDLQALIKNCK